MVVGSAVGCHGGGVMVARLVLGSGTAVAENHLPCRFLNVLDGRGWRGVITAIAIRHNAVVLF